MKCKVCGKEEDKMGWKCSECFKNKKPIPGYIQHRKPYKKYKIAMEVIKEYFDESGDYIENIYGRLYKKLEQ